MSKRDVVLKRYIYKYKGLNRTYEKICLTVKNCAFQNILCHKYNYLTPKT